MDYTVVYILVCGPWRITPSTALWLAASRQRHNNDIALIFWITTKLTLKNTKITTENIRIIGSQMQSKETN